MRRFGLLCWILAGLILAQVVEAMSGFQSFTGFQAQAENRALIVGIGDYDTEKTGWLRLHGDRDVDLLSECLIRRGFSPQNIVTLKNEEATKTAILNALKVLASQTKPGDCVIFHFSGHGQQVTDLHGDEKNGYDEAIIPYDAFRTPRYELNGRPYKGENHIIDDELFPLFNEIKRKAGQNGYFLVLNDACYSQNVVMFEGPKFEPEEIARLGNVRGTDHVFKIDNTSPLAKLAKPDEFVKTGKLVEISACLDYEQNFEYVVPNSDETFGSLTYTIVYLLNKRLKFSDIEKYFQNREYTKDKIFVSFQHPKITVY